MRALAAFALCGVVVAQGATDPGKAQAPRMEFEPPAPGSYVLQRIQRAADGTLLDASGRVLELGGYTTGKITLLTFFYTYCVDPWGCPFAYKTLTELRERILSDARLASRVRFVSVSFDPTHDTPSELARYGRQLGADPRFEWRFLTARSVPELLPILEGFGQDVSVAYDEKGRPTRTMNHMLKMFLIDRHGIVREIYSLAYLQQQMMLNDIRTLAIEETRALASVRSGEP